MVFYSAIRDIDGEGRLLKGFVLETEELITKTLEPFLKHTGGLMSKLNAWLIMKGMEKIELWVWAQVETATKILTGLYGHSLLEVSFTPGMRRTRNIEL